MSITTTTSETTRVPAGRPAPQVHHGAERRPHGGDGVAPGATSRPEPVDAGPVDPARGMRRWDAKHGRSVQVAFVGPFGVGKTTAVSTLCGDDLTVSEVRRSTATGYGRRIKESTTVGLELGRYTAGDGRRVVVVGTPGQQRYDAVRRSAMPRSSAVVLWLFGDHEYATVDLELWAEFIASEVKPETMVVAVTRVGENGIDPTWADVLARVAPGARLVAADPRDRVHVAAAVAQALELVPGDAGGRADDAASPAGPVLEQTS